MIASSTAGSEYGSSSFVLCHFYDLNANWIFMWAALRLSGPQGGRLLGVVRQEWFARGWDESDRSSRAALIPHMVFVYPSRTRCLCGFIPPFGVKSQEGNEFLPIDFLHGVFARVLTGSLLLMTSRYFDRLASPEFTL